LIERLLTRKGLTIGDYSFKITTKSGEEKKLGGLFINEGILVSSAKIP
jgi:hypothetical protein